jgi:serine/threonine-protein kinase
MGAVYLGIDPDSAQPVAIKTMALAAEFAGTDLEDVRERFFREARTAGRLHHPDIVAIHEAAEDAGIAYIAMEYLSGCDLQRHT